MKLNLGKTDRIIRVILAAAMAVLYFTGLLSGTPAVILGGAAIVILLTALIGFCPIYAPFKFSTRK